MSQLWSGVLLCRIFIFFIWVCEQAQPQILINKTYQKLNNQQGILVAHILGPNFIVDKLNGRDTPNVNHTQISMLLILILGTLYNILFISLAIQQCISDRISFNMMYHKYGSPNSEKGVVWDGGVHGTLMYAWRRSFPRNKTDFFTF